MFFFKLILQLREMKMSKVFYINSLDYKDTIVGVLKEGLWMLLRIQIMVTRIPAAGAKEADARMCCTVFEALFVPQALMCTLHAKRMI